MDVVAQRKTETHISASLSEKGGTAADGAGGRGELPVCLGLNQRHLFGITIESKKEKKRKRKSPTSSSTLGKG